jgi:hypothetical protein
MQVRYEGTLKMEGDFRRPGETRSYDLEQRFRRWPDGRVQADWTTWSESDTAHTRVVPRMR